MELYNFDQKHRETGMKPVVSISEKDMASIKEKIEAMETLFDCQVLVEFDPAEWNMKFYEDGKVDFNKHFQIIKLFPPVRGNDKKELKMKVVQDGQVRIMGSDSFTIKLYKGIAKSPFNSMIAASEIAAEVLKDETLSSSIATRIILAKLRDAKGRELEPYEIDNAREALKMFGL